MFAADKQSFPDGYDLSGTDRTPGANRHTDPDDHCNTGAYCDTGPDSYRNSGTYRYADSDTVRDSCTDRNSETDFYAASYKEADRVAGNSRSKRHHK